MRGPTALFLIVTACAPPPEDATGLDPAIASALQEALDRSRLSVEAPGAVLGVTLADGQRWIGTSGDADAETKRAVVPEDPFRIGSITKTYGAVVVLQLVEEGRLGLDDPATTWLPWLGDDRITVRLLLEHRTGIVDYTDTGPFLAAFGQPATHEEVVQMALGEGLDFTPGERHAYSNTNYYALALVVEAITGRDWHLSIRERLLDPLGLDDTWLEGPEDRPSGTVEGYLGGNLATDALDPAWTWASGGLVSTAADQLDWLDALLDGPILEPASRTLMLTARPLPDGTLPPYGLGVALRDDTPCGPLVGHTGSTMGFQSDLFEDDAGARLVALVNDFASEASDVAYAGCAALR